jgi:ATP phosphoribosyltransferase regulatory subunit
MTSFGYLPADVPIIQPAEVFLTRAGDQILHRLFTFERHGVSLALRPEFTSPALLRYISETPEGKQTVARWQFAGIIFEDDPASGSLDYERVSSGAEFLGLPGVGAEAEVIVMAVEGCHALGQSIGKVVLGSAQIVRSVLAAHQLDLRTQQFILSQLHHLYRNETGVENVMSLFDAQTVSSDDLDAPDYEQTPQDLMLLLNVHERGRAMGGRTQADVARRLLEKRRRAAQRPHVLAALTALRALSQIKGAPEMVFPALEQAAVTHGYDWKQMLDNWRKLIRLLAAYDMDPALLSLEPGLARDWEYYSGLMFELYTTDGRHVAGGGRYDEFARFIGAQNDIPAVGFTYYLSQLLAHSSQMPSTSQMVTLAAPAEDERAIRWASLLRRHKIDLEILSEQSTCILRLQDDGSLQYGDEHYFIEQAEPLIIALSGFQS